MPTPDHGDPRLLTETERAVELFDRLTGGYSWSTQEPRLIGKSFVNGRWIVSEKEFEVVNPATGSLLGVCSEASESAVDETFAAAKVAHFRWQHLIGSLQKKAVFERLWRLIDEHKAELATLFTLEGGKTIGNSLADIVESEHTIMAAHNTVHDDEGTVGPAQMPNKFAGTLAWPFRVEMAIKPFNFIAIYWWKVAASVMAGTAVIIKEAEQIPFTAMCMTALFHQALRDALGAETADKLGGLVQLLQGRGETVGRYAVNHGTDEEASYDILSATGSWRMASDVASVAGKKVRPTRIEASGHNRSLVWHDYPLDKAAEEICLAAFGDSGQRCVSTKMVFVPRAHFNALLAKVTERAKSLRIGDPLDRKTDLGPIISAEQLRAVEDAVGRTAKDYKPWLGGYRLTEGLYLREGQYWGTIAYAKSKGFNFDPADFAKGTPLGLSGNVSFVKKGGALAYGYWYVPTIFVNLPFYHDICRYEVFGPVLVFNELEFSWESRVSSPGYEPEKDLWIQEYIDAKDLSSLPDVEWFLRGVALMNDNLFGLSSSCYSYDARYFMHYLALAESGLRYVGRGTTGAEVDDHTEFGGGKLSGYGREGGSVKNARRKAQFYVDYHGKTRLAQRDQ
ncbi:MAG: aldehyde dehydrogenase family protein [Candidatus Sungbacteria bacterium]|nr:aldehyde dehydrogenase family protein [Candidatus Sungbacteria bacterium]